jgi:NAD-dependent SIR2 family protein deacetylase
MEKAGECMGEVKLCNCMRCGRSLYDVSVVTPNKDRICPQCYLDGKDSFYSVAIQWRYETNLQEWITIKPANMQT